MPPTNYEPTPGPVAIRTRGLSVEHVSLVGFRGVIVAVVKAGAGRKMANAAKLARGWNSLDRHTRYIAELEATMTKLVWAAEAALRDERQEPNLATATDAAKDLLKRGAWERPIVQPPPAPTRQPRILRETT